MSLIGISLLVLGVIIVATMSKRKTSFYGGLIISGFAFTSIFSGFALLLLNFTK